MELLTLDALTVTVIVSLFIPIATGVVTKYTASATLKQVTTLVFSTVTGILAQGATDAGGAVLSKEAITAAVVSLIIAITSYLGIYKPHDINAKLAPDSGIGR